MNTKTYRGRSLEELLPKVRAELGPDAVIVRQREGLTGGVGGFFQKKLVEIEAAAPEGAEPPPAAARAPLPSRWPAEASTLRDELVARGVEHALADEVVEE